MTKLNLLSSKKMAKILLLLGFNRVRVRGSHHFFFNPITKKTATLPIHGNEYLSVGVLKEILRDTDLSVKDYETLRQEV